MARDVQTTIRSGGARLETAALLLAAFTALVAIARYDAGQRACTEAPPAAIARPAVARPPAPPSEAEAARQAILRDMLLHD